MRGTFGQGEAVCHDDEGTGSTRMAHPTEIFPPFSIALSKLPIAPITHPAKCYLRFDELCDRLIRTQSRVIGVHIILHLGKQLHSLFYPRVVPLHCAAE